MTRYSYTLLSRSVKVLSCRKSNVFIIDKVGNEWVPGIIYKLYYSNL